MFRLNFETIKGDEEAFRRLIGNCPQGYGRKFQPNGLDGDSWTFFRSDDGSLLLQRKSTAEVLDIIGYAKRIGISLSDLAERFPSHQENNSKSTGSETLQSWLHNHGLTKTELEGFGWKIAENKISIPIKTDDGVRYHYRHFGDPQSRFSCDKGLKTSHFFYSPAELINQKKLVICAGAADCLNAHLALSDEFHCIGLLGERTIPNSLIQIKDKFAEIIIAFDNDHTGLSATKDLAEKLYLSVKSIDWSDYEDIKDLSQLAAKHGRKMIHGLVHKATAFESASEKAFSFREYIKSLPDSIDPKEVFAQPLANALIQAAESVQVPVELLITPLLPILASCIGNSMIEAKPGYTQPSVLFAMSLAPTGSNKNWMQKVLIEPLGKKNKIASNLYKRQKAEYEASLKKRQKEDSQVPLSEPIQSVYMANGGTTEGLGNGKYLNPRGGLLLASAEAEHFVRGMNKYSNSDSNDLIFWNIAWDGGDCSKILAKEFRESFNLRISLCLSGHPDKTIEAFKHIAKEDLSEDPRGYLARWLICATPCPLPELTLNSESLKLPSVLEELINQIFTLEGGHEDL